MNEPDGNDVTRESRTREFQRSLPTAMGDPVFRLDRDGVILDMNPSGRRWVVAAGSRRFPRIFRSVRPWSTILDDLERRGSIRVMGMMHGMEGAGHSIFAILEAVDIAAEITARIYGGSVPPDENARLFERLPDGVVVFNAEGRILNVNPALEKMVGRGCDEIVGRPFIDLFARTSRSAAASALENGKGENAEFELMQTRGPAIAVELSLELAAADTPTSFAIFHDLTRRRSLESQLRQSQKMEAVGALVGGVAHDFNNLLTVILGQGDEMLSQVLPDDPIRASLESLIESGERAAALTDQLLTFCRRQMLRLTDVDLNTVVSETERILHRVIGEDVILDINLTQDDVFVHADATQLSQVLMNLAVNARDAMPEGGRLRISTSRVGQDGVDEIQLVVTDSGRGMDDQTRGRIFEPFFTTKGPGLGTGLGLSTVFGIIKKCGGKITVESATGLGTTFRITMQPVEASPKIVSAGPREAGIETLPSIDTVLLVEDDRDVREFIQSALERSGVHVIAARDGRQALEIVERDPKARIDVVVTDLVLPHMCGSEFIRRLRQSRPDVKALFVSGYSDPSRLVAVGSTPSSAFLQKPFRTTALFGALESLVAVSGDAAEG